MNLAQRIGHALGLRTGPDRDATVPGPVTPEAPRDVVESIRGVFYPNLFYRNDNYRNSLPSYVRMVDLAYHAGSRNVLELGAGLSTGLWARFAKNTGANVTSICSRFGPTREYLRDTEELALLDAHVRCIEGFTLSADDLREFLAREDRTSFAGVPVDRIIAGLGPFVVGPISAVPSRRRRELLAECLRDSRAVGDILRDGEYLRFPPALLDCYATEFSLQEELSSYREARGRGTGGVLDELPRDGGEMYDFVFFDSGELSSMLEWQRLRDRIVVGGFAAFHDIFFPKSFKNFLVCASVRASGAWRTVLLDDSTPQGLLVARRVR